MSSYKEAPAVSLSDPTTGGLVGLLGADGKEYFLPAQPVTSALTPSVVVDSNANDIQKAGQADQSYSYQTPLTGATIVVANNSRTLTLDPAGTLASLTVQMPPTPVDGQLVELSTTQILTSLTISANTGQTLGNGMPSSAAAGQGYGFIYRLALTKWFRTY